MGGSLADELKTEGLTKVSPAGETIRVLQLIRDGKYASQIARELHVSNSMVNKHIKRLLLDDLIVPQMYSSYKAYTLTDRGLTTLLRVSKSGLEGFTPVKTRTPNMHNIAYVVDFLPQNEIPYDKLVNMNGWKRSIKRYMNATVSWWFVPKPKMTISIDEIPIEDDINNVLIKAQNTALAILGSLEKEFGIKINYDNMKLVKKPHFAFDDPYIKKVSKNFTISTPDAKIDRSDGYGELEYLKPELAQAYIDMPKNVNALLMLQQNQVLIMDDFSKNIKLHLEVMAKMNEIMNKMERKLDV